MPTKSVPRAITHVGLTVSDITKAINWYQEVFGFQLLNEPYTIDSDDATFEHDIFGEFDRMTMAHLGTGNQVGLELFEFETSDGMTETDFTSPGLNHFCVIDPDIEEMINTIEENGGMQHSPIERPFDDRPYQFAFCRDPWDNHIEIYTHSYEQFMAPQ
ncbi:VOC family protein [Halorubrum vacuolatum]|uniref:Catechol 2,3-dioxygenase n=1 Tax=Halorubrum vacuolatum TaxID=63740 RepID=A0A238XPZ7_HALVU|nr:VOC family protein [Halorubrum vacuolatum]SNR60752.1 Catechol 2,3-dioxygenase [Halorubrum vacuolatum]